MKTLKDCLPHEALSGEFEGCRFLKYLDVEVVSENDFDKKPWPGTHRYVYTWYELKNGYAVGWNENPSRGWSFPVLKMKG